MNNNHRITRNTNKNIIVGFTNERIIPASGLAVVGALFVKSDFIKKLNRMDVTSNRSQHQIKNGDIVLTYLGLLCMGKPYFEAVHEMDDDKDFYKAALGITRSIPSEETLRQRMDDIGDSLRQTILEQNVEMLLANKIQPTALANGLVPVDIDVTPMDNSKSKKEGVSRTLFCPMRVWSHSIAFLSLSPVFWIFFKSTYPTRHAITSVMTLFPRPKPDKFPDMLH